MPGPRAWHRFRSTLAVARREGREVTFATAMGRLRPAIRRGVADARTRAAARLAAMTLCLGAFALAGIIVSLRAFSTASYQVGPALMSISTSFADHGTRRPLRPDRRLGRPGPAVHGADPHVRDRRLGRPAGGAAHPADARRRARPAGRGRGAGSGAPSAAPSSARRSSCCSAVRRAASSAASCSTPSSTAGACCSSGSPPASRRRRGRWPAARSRSGLPTTRRSASRPSTRTAATCRACSSSPTG